MQCNLKLYFMGKTLYSHRLVALNYLRLQVECKYTCSEEYFFPPQMVILLC